MVFSVERENQMTEVGIGNKLIEDVLLTIVRAQREAQVAGLTFVDAGNMSLSAMATVIGGHIVAMTLSMPHLTATPEEVIASFAGHVREEYLDAATAMSGIRPEPEPEIAPGAPNPKSPWAP